MLGFVHIFNKFKYSKQNKGKALVIDLQQLQFLQNCLVTYKNKNQLVKSCNFKWHLHKLKNSAKYKRNSLKWCFSHQKIYTFLA